MAAQKTITINGRLYDAVTGLPVTTRTPQSAPKPASAPKVASASKVSPTPRPVAAPQPSAAVKPASKPTSKAVPASRSQATATNVHSNVQKSQTLMRRAAKKPATPAKVVRRSQPGRHMDIARSNSVSKFAPHPAVKEAAPTPTPKPVVKSTPDKPARVHPTAEKALKKAARKKQAALKASKPVTSKDIKDAEIAKALATPKPKQKKAPKNKWINRLIIIGSIIVALGLILFAIYKFIPSVSVSLAAAQAGIEARYPEYTPDGYSLSQPVTYNDGEVSLTFRSNSNDTSYLINQKRSSWDSSAVLDNVVKPAVGENYTTTKERGLTIYSYDKGAAWVNGGLLYTINGDAPLSGDQIRRLATSL